MTHFQTSEANDRIKYIYWFAYYNTDSPSVRYRGQYPLDFLKSNFGINSFFITPGYMPVNVFRFVKAYLSVLFFRKKNSLIVIQRVNSNFIYANALKFLIRIRKSNTIYDIDDADYLEFSPETINHFIRNCSSVSVGSNELLKNLASKSKNIFINTSPTPDLKIIKRHKNSFLTIGWIGSFGGGHKEGLLKYLFPALKDLPFQIKLVLLGVAKESEFEFLKTYFTGFNKVTLEMPQIIDWSDEADIQNKISGFDIGIATLIDNELQRSKSAFKTKQYLNNGVPVLSSDLPENNRIVEHGKNGFLCPDVSDFRQRIIEINLMSDKEYNTISENARLSIHNFNLENYCNILLNNYQRS